jgi:hypothetical protein
VAARRDAYPTTAALQFQVNAPYKGQLVDRVRYAAAHFLCMAYSFYESGSDIPPSARKAAFARQSTHAFPKRRIAILSVYRQQQLARRGFSRLPYPFQRCSGDHLWTRLLSWNWRREITVLGARFSCPEGA